MQVMCHWSLNLIFRAKLKLESGNRKSNIASRWQILKVTSLKINRLLPIATNNVYMKFKFQSKLELRSGNHVTYRRTDRQTDKVNPVYPPTNFVGRSIMILNISNGVIVQSCRIKPSTCTWGGAFLSSVTFKFDRWPWKTKEHPSRLTFNCDNQNKKFTDLWIRLSNCTCINVVLP